MVKNIVVTHRGRWQMKLESFVFEKFARDGWVVVDDALPKDQWRAWAQSLDQAHIIWSAAGIGTGHEKSVQTHIRGDSILWIPDHPTDWMAQPWQWVETGRRICAKELRTALRWSETHFANYPPGAGYDWHVDQSRSHGHRQITFILYLNENWRSEDGGQLEIKTTDAPLLVDPQGGRLVLFSSERFSHRVLPSKRPRKSLTGWFRDDDPL